MANSSLQYINAVSGSGETFGSIFSKANAAIDFCKTLAVSVDGTTNGGLTTGNARVNGYFTANSIAVGSLGLRGGNNATSGVLPIVSNVSVGNSTVNVVVTFGAVTAGISVVNATTVAVGSNVVLNSSAIGLGANVFLSQGSLFVGNSTINAVVNSTGFFVNGSTLTVVAGGSNTHVQFNDSGSFGGTAGLTWTKTSNTLAVGNLVTAVKGTFTTEVDIGSNVVITVGGWSVGNSTVNTQVNSTGFFVGTGSSVNSSTVSAAVLNAATLSLATSYSVGNSTVNVASNSTQVSGARAALTTAVNVGSNVLANTSALSVGNSTVNVVINSSTVAIGGVSVTALPKVSVANNDTVIGTQNTINFIAGTNVTLDITNDVGQVNVSISATPVGGAAYVAGTNTQVQYNDTGNFGASSGFAWNKATNVLSVSNALAIGANVSLTVGGLSVGNSTVNAVVNSTNFVTGNLTATGAGLSVVGNPVTNVVVNSSAVTLFVAGSRSATLSGTQLVIFNGAGQTGTLEAGNLVIGAMSVNNTVVAVGANVKANTSSLVVGNSTISAFVNSSLIQVSNAIQTTNVTVSGFFVGNTSVNSSAVSVGNSTVNVVINSSAVALSGVTIGTGAAAGSNTEIQYNNSGAFGTSTTFTWNKTAGTLLIGNSTVNLSVNSTTIQTGRVPTGAAGLVMNQMWAIGDVRRTDNALNASSTVIGAEWLRTDGAVLSQTTYADYYARVGLAYSTVDVQSVTGFQAFTAITPYVTRPVFANGASLNCFVVAVGNGAATALTNAAVYTVAPSGFTAVQQFNSNTLVSNNGSSGAPWVGPVIATNGTAVALFGNSGATATGNTRAVVGSNTTNWAAVANVLATNSASALGAVWGNNVWVVAFSGNSTVNGFFRTTTDVNSTSTWTTRGAFNAGEQLAYGGFGYADGLFLAFSNVSGVYATSTDGTTWTRRTNGPNTVLIAGTGGRYIGGSGLSTGGFGNATFVVPNELGGVSWTTNGTVWGSLDLVTTTGLQYQVVAFTFYDTGAWIIGDGQFVSTTVDFVNVRTMTGAPVAIATSSTPSAAPWALSSYQGKMFGWSTYANTTLLGSGLGMMSLKSGSGVGFNPITQFPLPLDQGGLINPPQYVKVY